MAWKCPACTYENSDGARVCDMCGKTRPPAGSPTRPSAVEQPAATLPPPRPPQQAVLHQLRFAIARADVDEARRILARLGIVLPEDDPPPPFDDCVPVGHPRALLRATPIIRSTTPPLDVPVPMGLPVHPEAAHAGPSQPSGYELDGEWHPSNQPPPPRPPAAVAVLFAKGDVVLYQPAQGAPIPAEILVVHNDGMPPYYTIRCEGVEKQVEQHRLALSLADPYLPCRTRSEEARISEADAHYARMLEEDERAERRRRESMYTFKCCICQEPCPVEGSFTAQSCDHRICSECFVGFVNANLSEEHVRCPHEGCGQPFEAAAICDALVRYGERDLAARFADARTEEALIADRSNFRRCPHPGCNYLFAWREGDRKHFDCPKCEHAFCLACTAAEGGGSGGEGARVSPAHPGRTCAQRADELRRDADERRRFDEWQQNNSRADELFAEYVANDQDTRACPGCQRVINRKEACDHSVPPRLEPTPSHHPSHHPLHGDLRDGSCCRTSCALTTFVSTHLHTAPFTPPRFHSPCGGSILDERTVTCQWCRTEFCIVCGKQPQCGRKCPRRR